MTNNNLQRQTVWIEANREYRVVHPIPRYQRRLGEFDHVTVSCVNERSTPLRAEESRKGLHCSSRLGLTGTTIISGYSLLGWEYFYRNWITVPNKSKFSVCSVFISWLFGGRLGVCTSETERTKKPKFRATNVTVSGPPRPPEGKGARTIGRVVAPPAPPAPGWRRGGGRIGFLRGRPWSVAPEFYGCDLKVCRCPSTWDLSVWC